MAPVQFCGLQLITCIIYHLTKNYYRLYNSIWLSLIKGNEIGRVKKSHKTSATICFLLLLHAIITHPYCTPTFSGLYSYIYKTGGRYCYNHALETFLYIIITSVSQESPYQLQASLVKIFNKHNVIKWSQEIVSSNSYPEIMEISTHFHFNFR